MTPAALELDGWSTYLTVLLLDNSKAKPPVKGRITGWVGDWDKYWKGSLQIDDCPGRCAVLRHNGQVLRSRSGGERVVHTARSWAYSGSGTGHTGTRCQVAGMMRFLFLRVQEAASKDQHVQGEGSGDASSTYQCKSLVTQRSHFWDNSRPIGSHFKMGPC